ncbi:hypothetical protein CLOP_g21591 [Closterium sp. NIES-67]|nr:hypothetical protein CLOP_g21591 [Closterium sp. NIES-67]
MNGRDFWMAVGFRELLRGDEHLAGLVAFNHIIYVTVPHEIKGQDVLWDIHPIHEVQLADEVGVAVVLGGLEPVEQALDDALLPSEGIRISRPF